jgi:hypothetical protein
MRTGEEIKGLYKTPDLVVGIKNRILEWFGHVIRMDKKFYKNI